MKRIDDTDLNQLFVQASIEIVDEERASAIKLIKKLAFKIAGLNNEIRKHKAGITKKEKQLEKANAVADRIKSGDWGALNEEENKEE